MFPGPTLRRLGYARRVKGGVDHLPEILQNESELIFSMSVSSDAAGIFWNSRCVTLDMSGVARVNFGSQSSSSATTSFLKSSFVVCSRLKKRPNLTQSVTSKFWKMKNTFVEWTTTTNKNISRPVVGRICSTVVEHTPRHLKVVATYPAGCWAFSSSSSFDFFSLSLLTFLPQWSVFNQLPQEGASLTVCCERNRRKNDAKLCCQE